MALPATSVFEVRTGGADTNGGGFSAGGTGTDYSQQTAPQFSGTNLASTSATSATPSVTSASHSFVSTDVDNFINISAGTNWTQGVYRIVSVSSGAAILDRACGTTATVSSGTWAEGGCFATLGKAVGLLTLAGMIAWIKGGTSYTLASGITTPAGVSNTAGFATVIGYTTIRGDNGKATLTAASSITAITDSTGGFRWVGLDIAGASTINIGFSLSGQNSGIIRCNVKSVNNNGINVTATAQNTNILQCELGACGSEGINFQGPTCHASGNYIHNSGSHGVEIIGSGIRLSNNIIANNNSKGILMNAAYSVNKSPILFNTIVGNASDGIANTGIYGMAEIANNIFASNGGFGLSTSAMNPLRDEALIHNNAYWNNTSGARSGNNAGSGDVTLTGDPFVNAAAFNYALNNTAGAGAACRGAGFPGIFPGGLSTGYIDIGAVQHQDPAGGSGMLYQQSLDGP